MARNGGQKCASSSAAELSLGVAVSAAQTSPQSPVTSHNTRGRVSQSVKCCCHSVVVLQTSHQSALTGVTSVHLQPERPLGNGHQHPSHQSPVRSEGPEGFAASLPRSRSALAAHTCGAAPCGGVAPVVPSRTLVSLSRPNPTKRQHGARLPRYAGARHRRRRRRSRRPRRL